MAHKYKDKEFDNHSVKNKLLKDVYDDVVMEEDSESIYDDENGDEDKKQDVDQQRKTPTTDEDDEDCGSTTIRRSSRLLTFAESKESRIDLGFVDPFPYTFLAQSNHFPSKIGGRPAFLSMYPVIGSKDVTCDVCHCVMRFIAQVYSTVPKRRDCFHRMFYIFGCGSTPECSRTQYAVFRSQLPLYNCFYSPRVPNFQQEDLTLKCPDPRDYGTELCHVCGIAAQQEFGCARCEEVHYCSSWHQQLDAKYHRVVCSKYNIELVKFDPYPGVVFPEYELVIEAQNCANQTPPQSEGEKDSYKECPLMNQFYDRLRSQSKPKYIVSAASKKKFIDNSNDDDMDIEEERKTFDHFKKETRELEALRYRSGWYKSTQPPDGDILWISNFNRLNISDAITTDNIDGGESVKKNKIEDSDTTAANNCNEVKTRRQPQPPPPPPPSPTLSPLPTVPPCERCGTPRKFEFQLMPRLLISLLRLNEYMTKSLSSSSKKGNPSSSIVAPDTLVPSTTTKPLELNFGTLLVFSCANSCDTTIQKVRQRGEKRPSPCSTTTSTTSSSLFAIPTVPLGNGINNNHKQSSITNTNVIDEDNNSSDGGISGNGTVPIDTLSNNQLDHQQNASSNNKSNQRKSKQLHRKHRKPSMVDPSYYVREFIYNQPIL